MTARKMTNFRFGLSEGRVLHKRANVAALLGRGTLFGVQGHKKISIADIGSYRVILPSVYKL